MLKKLFDFLNYCESKSRHFANVMEAFKYESTKRVIDFTIDCCSGGIDIDRF